MIIASCPLRISLVGGSTDGERFLQKYGIGSVISFPSNLRTYVTIHQDVFGSNSIGNNYIINYSKREEVKNISDINNEMVRNCFQYFNVKQMNCSLTSDIYSVGSGLAASSSYLQSLIKSIYVLRGKKIDDFAICKLAQNIEKKFNPLVGQQDFYGSMGGFKRIYFYKDKDPKIKYLSTEIFENLKIYLLFTGVLRQSTSILETIDIDKSHLLLNDVENLENAINECDIQKFNDVIRHSWESKKETSKYICENAKIIELDNKLKNDKNVLSHKLCGAGNGGYFLIFTNKNTILEDKYNMIRQINISDSGINFINFQNEYTRI